MNQLVNEIMKLINELKSDVPVREHDKIDHLRDLVAALARQVPATAKSTFIQNPQSRE